MTNAPASIQTLGQARNIGGHLVYICRVPSKGLDLFRVTIELEHNERASAEFVLVGGQVLLQYAAPGLLRPYGGAHEGRERLQAALQAALKVPGRETRPQMVARLALAVAREELAAAKAATAAERNPRTCKAYNLAWCRYHKARMAALNA